MSLKMARAMCLCSQVIAVTSMRPVTTILTGLAPAAPAAWSLEVAARRLVLTRVLVALVMRVSRALAVETRRRQPRQRRLVVAWMLLRRPPHLQSRFRLGAGVAGRAEKEAL